MNRDDPRPDPADRWSVLSPHLDRALEMAPGERSAWLAQLEAVDAKLAAEIASLLAEHGALDREGFLERGAPDSTTVAPSLAGLVVGSYTLRAPLGQGGMGSVWLADRTDGRFKGTAAVKLLNASLIGHEGERRFRREGSILARLRHPGIARLHDAGLSPLGQPYIVLEHVDGEPIDRFCAARGLDVHGRLRLFLEVLEAVAHAHGNLIVHRDIKPQNVLVDADGKVRLLDFGVAKLIDPGPDSEVTATREGGAGLTPDYAAPEQVTGGDVTTATDVYGLGALLYVLLAGRLPLEASSTTPVDRIRAIVEREPPPMSEAADPSRRAALRGDLDNVVAKALRKRPEERYASVAAFADDIRRWLNHEPVSARAVSPAYRAAKFVRRHRTGVALAALAATGAVVLTAGIAWQAREARRQRDAARSQLARANAARDFMAFLLSAAQPIGAKPAVGDLLEQGKAVIDKQYPGDDPLRAELLVAIGRQYSESERYDRAVQVLEEAAAIAARSGDPVLQAQALCPLGNAKLGAGDIDGAGPLIEKALAMLPDRPENTLQRAECLIGRGATGYMIEDPAPMLRDGEAALALLARVDSPPPVRRIEAQALLAYGYYLSHQMAKADAQYAEIADGLQRAGRERTTLAADTYNNWSLVHYEGNLSRAEPLCRRAVELRRAVEGADGIAPSVTFNHAGVLLQLARYDEAEPLYQETIRVARARQFPLIETDAMLELSDLYTRRGEFARAAAQLETLGPLLTGPNPNAFRLVQLAFYRGRLALARHDAASARSLFAGVVDTFEKRNSHLSLRVFALVGLAQAEQETGDLAAAGATARHAKEIALTFVEKDAPSYLIGLSEARIASIEAATGDAAGARTSYGSALRHLKTTLGEDHPETRAALEGLRVLGAS
ncbi:MAG TPA: protein kinase [Candidatus Polarisedimenticolia bacterium]|nr:protein kinase [Candidatus Polarisedimenticolia bacterium]